jgi:thiol-disulfide isomerase/thioredoxin
MRGRLRLLRRFGADPTGGAAPEPQPSIVTRPRTRRTHRGAAALLLAILAAVVVLAGCSSGTDAAVFGGSFTFVSPDGKVELSYPEGDRQGIPAMSGPSVADPKVTVSTDDFPGRAVVLNFWGSWCAPCRAEADDLNAAATALAPLGVQFIGLNVKDSRAPAADFEAGKQTPYPSIFDPAMRTMLSLRGYPTSGIPSTIVLDDQHRVAQIWLRPITETLVATVRSIVGSD